MLADDRSSEVKKHKEIYERRLYYRQFVSIDEKSSQSELTAHATRSGLAQRHTSHWH